MSEELRMLTNKYLYLKGYECSLTGCTWIHGVWIHACVYVCGCAYASLCLPVCLCVQEREGERNSLQGTLCISWWHVARWKSTLQIPVLTGACSCPKDTQSTQTSQTSFVQTFLTLQPSKLNNPPPSISELLRLSCVKPARRAKHL